MKADVKTGLHQEMKDARIEKREKRVEDRKEVISDLKSKVEDLKASRKDQIEAAGSKDDRVKIREDIKAEIKTKREEAKKELAEKREERKTYCSGYWLCREYK
jgi:SNF2 family DNA or RNA helicase